jgi:hypothetical protein
MRTLTGHTFVFPPHNGVRYGQDLRYHRGVPDGVLFTFDGFAGDRVILVAPGYGGKPYGDGAIYVSFEDAEQHVTADTPVMTTEPTFAPVETVDLEARLAPYTVFEPEPDLRTELLVTNLRYISAVLAADRVPAVTRAEVGKRIERCLELLG